MFSTSEQGFLLIVVHIQILSLPIEVGNTYRYPLQFTTLEPI